MARTEDNNMKSQKKSSASLKAKVKPRKKDMVVDVKLSKGKIASKNVANKSKVVQPGKKVIDNKKVSINKAQTVKKEKVQVAKVKASKVVSKVQKAEPIKLGKKRKTRVISTVSKSIDISSGKTKFGKDLTERQRASTRFRAKNNEKPTAQAQALLAPTEEMLKPFRDAAKKNQLNQKAKQKESKQKSFLAKPQKTGKKVTVDLRLHSPMSEGYFSTGGVDPAGAMIRLAKAKGLDIIAVTDYHSAEFLEIVQEKAKDTTVSVLPGIDLRCKVHSCDEIYFIALFEEGKTSEDLYKVLARMDVPLSARGSKSFVMNKSLKEIIEVVEQEGGVLIPSRIDKTPHRLHAAKTLVEDFGFHAFDMVHPENPDFFKDRWPAGEFTFFSFSNANSLGQVGSRTFSTKIPSDGFKGLKELVGRRRAQV